MKLKFSVVDITPDPTQYKKFLTKYTPHGVDLAVEIEVPDSDVVSGNGNPDAYPTYVLTEYGMSVVLSKLGRVAAEAEQLRLSR